MNEGPGPHLGGTYDLVGLPTFPAYTDPPPQPHLNTHETVNMHLYHSELLLSIFPLEPGTTRLVLGLEQHVAPNKAFSKYLLSE